MMDAFGGKGADFRAEARLLHRGLLDNGYDELAIHKDPLDRMLVAQSSVEGVLLLTADPISHNTPIPRRV